MGQMGRRGNVNWAEGRDCDSENGGGELVGGSDPGGFTCGHGGDKTGASKPYSHWFILGHPFLLLLFLFILPSFSKLTGPSEGA